MQLCGPKTSSASRKHEQASPARRQPPSPLPTWRRQALDAFDDACSPETVFTPRKIWPLQPSDSVGSRRTLSEITQRNFCLTATLFTAFAAEAFVNNFLDVHHLKAQISASSFKKIDRGGTVQKYVEGVALAYEPLFQAGDEAMPAISELFDVRNELVHARPGIGPQLAYMPDPTWRGLYPPRTVATWLIAVAGAADLMERRCYGFDYHSFPAAFIWHGRTIVVELAAHAQPLPDAAATGRAPLIQLLSEAATERARESAGVRLTVDELRGARVEHAAKIGPWDKFTELIARGHHSGSAEPPPST